MIEELNINKSSFPSNSHKAKMENSEGEDKRSKLDPIINRDGIASTKKPLSQKFSETFMSEDTDSVKNYILMDVIIPGVKNALLDIMEMAFFGNVSGRNRNRNHRNDGKTDYRSYYGGSSSRSERERRDRRDERRARRDDKIDYRNIVLKNRSDTEDVIDEMHRRIRKYGSVSIADMLDLLGEVSNYNDNNWGWTDERDIGIRRVSNGYLIDVVEAEYLNS